MYATSPAAITISGRSGERIPIPLNSNRRMNAPGMSVQLAVPGWIFRTVRSVNGSGLASRFGRTNPGHYGEEWRLVLSPASPATGRLECQSAKPSGSLLPELRNRNLTSCSGTICRNLCRSTLRQWGNTRLGRKSSGYAIEALQLHGFCVSRVTRLAVNSR